MSILNAHSLVAVAQLLRDGKAVLHTGDLLDDRVDLRRTETHPLRVENTVGAAAK